MSAASTALPVLDAEGLRHLVAATATACAPCAKLVCPGWEALPSADHAAHLQRIATLRQPGEDEPTLSEHHPEGTHYWSPQAPLAVAFFPANRSEVWQCPACRRAYLRYTEYGGYYQEERIRQVQAALVA